MFDKEYKRDKELLDRSRKIHNDYIASEALKDDEIKKLATEIYNNNKTAESSNEISFSPFASSDGVAPNQADFEMQEGIKAQNKQLIDNLYQKLKEKNIDIDIDKVVDMAGRMSNKEYMDLINKSIDDYADEGLSLIHI